MTDKLYSFADHPDHEAQLAAYAQRWIDNALSCRAMDDHDREQMRIAIAGLYESASLEPPERVAFVGGPITGAIAFGVAAGVWYLREHPEVHEPLFGRRLDEAELVAAIPVACAFAVIAAMQATQGISAPDDEDDDEDDDEPDVAGDTQNVALDASLAIGRGAEGWDRGVVFSAVRDPVIHASDRTVDGIRAAVEGATASAVAAATRSAPHQLKMRVRTIGHAAADDADAVAGSVEDAVAPPLSATLEATMEAIDAATESVMPTMTKTVETVWHAVRNAGVRDAVVDPVGVDLRGHDADVTHHTVVSAGRPVHDAMHAAVHAATAAAVDASAEATHRGVRAAGHATAAAVDYVASVAASSITHPADFVQPVVQAVVGAVDAATRASTRAAPVIEAILLSHEAVRPLVDATREIDAATRAATSIARTTIPWMLPPADRDTRDRVTHALAETGEFRATVDAVEAAVEAATSSVNATIDIATSTRRSTGSCAPTTRDLAVAIDAWRVRETTALALEATASAVHDTVHRATVEAGIDPAVNHATAGAVREARAATHRATDATDALRARMVSAPLDDTSAAVRHAVEDATTAATLGAANASRAPDAAIDALVRYLVRCVHRWPSCYQGGNTWSGWTAYLSFFRDVAGLELPEYERYRYWELGAIHGGWRYMHRRFTIVCDRPEVIRRDERHRPHAIGAPFIVWRDGFEAYFVAGVHVKREIAMGEFSARAVLEERNVEVRRIMIDIYDRDERGRWLRDVGATVLHTDLDPFGRPRRLLRVFLDEDEPYVAIEVVNSTPEPVAEEGRIASLWYGPWIDADGVAHERRGFRRYCLRVDPALRPLPPRGRPTGDGQDLTCHNAVASLHGMRGADYRPAVET